MHRAALRVDVPAVGTVGHRRDPAARSSQRLRPDPVGRAVRGVEKHFEAAEVSREAGEQAREIELRQIRVHARQHGLWLPFSVLRLALSGFRE